MPLTLKYDEQEFATTIRDRSADRSWDIQNSFDITDNPARKVWIHAAIDDIRPMRWRVQAWEGDPFNADLLEEVTCTVRDICASMEYLCSDIIRGLRVIDGGSTLVAENIVEAVVRQDPEVLTPEVCDAILQMAIWGDVLHK
ncbi:hypothetical protein [Herbaspirillum sp.]|uniref:hypothetical protein n=1 Tax=Herbaspirillum sp. TaxID=1890675 RepID=UPI000C106386|nr:hypothetical protein [Herbaspirillum sp.]MBO18862.1 hypothetical protein [Herbaspirillum sp.]|tara:strand:- start:8 stop:433 length:426 start_codon:yes stop_codon:yes gene_type:complete